MRRAWLALAALWPGLALAQAPAVTLAPSGLFLLPAQHAGRDYRFVFDTGSSLTVVDAGHAAALTRAPTDAERAQFAALGLHDLPPAQARAAHLAVSLGLRYAGRTLPAGEPVQVADLHPLSVLLGVDIAGLLGLADIRRLAWVIADRTLAAGSEAVLSEAACMAPVADSRTWITLPATFGALTVPVQLDTGSNVFLRLSPPTLAALDRRGLLRATGAASGLSIAGGFAAASGRIATMRVGPAAFADLPVQAAESDALGLPFLTAFLRAVLDLPRSRLCFVVR